jgi:hypothetical protein
MLLGRVVESCFRLRFVLVLKIWDRQIRCQVLHEEGAVNLLDVTSWIERERERERESVEPSRCVAACSEHSYCIRHDTLHSAIPQLSSSVSLLPSTCLLTRRREFARNRICQRRHKLVGSGICSHSQVRRLLRDRVRLFLTNQTLRSRPSYQKHRITVLNVDPLLGVRWPPASEDVSPGAGVRPLLKTQQTERT